ncbi:MAG: hypothetical protein K6E51_02150 [Treponema sp.]|nr:hypothetical protein [Treponema sp.]
MTDIQQLSIDIDGMLAVFNSCNPLSATGTFDMEAVKHCIMQLCDLVVKNTEERDALKQWMIEKSDFFKGPASTRFHGNFEGGLAVHSLKVLHQALLFALPLLANYAVSPLKDSYSITAEDIFIAAITHDFCKANTYKVEYRNSKDVFGNWKKTPYYKTIEESRNLGHGNESVLELLEIMPSFIHRRHVLEAISRHMGFSDLSDSEKYNYSNFLDNPLVVLIQLADQTASQWYNL